MNRYDYDFNESLGVWLTVTTQAYHRRMEERLAPHGITFRQVQVIGWLAMEGELAQSEFARKMMIEPSTVVRLLDRMEHSGLIERVTVPVDRRKHVVRLTEAAAPVWKRITTVARQIRKEAAGDLSPEELTTLKTLLQRVLSHLDISEATCPRSAALRTKKKVIVHE